MRVCVCVCVLTGLFSINNDLVLCYMSLTDLHVIIYGIFFTLVTANWLGALECIGI